MDQAKIEVKIFRGICQPSVSHGQPADDFEIKDLGPLKYFVGMEFARFKEGMFVNQHKCILDLLGETGLLDCEAIETPLEPHLKFQSMEAEEMVHRTRIL